MKKTHLFALVDTALALAATGLLATGFLIEFVLPPRSGPVTVWALSRHDWGQIHFWLAVTMLALAAIHLGLHWTWVCSMCAQLFGATPGQPLSRNRRLAASVTIALFVALLAGFLIAAQLSKSSTPTPRGPHRLITLPP